MRSLRSLSLRFPKGSPPQSSSGFAASREMTRLPKCHFDRSAEEAAKAFHSACGVKMSNKTLYARVRFYALGVRKEGILWRQNSNLNFQTA